MFIVYTPEGRNRIQPGELAPQLKVAQTKRVNPVGQSEMDQMHFEEAMAQVHEKTQPAVKEYQSIQNKSERKPVVKVYEIMTQPVITIGEETSLGQAWQKWSSRTCIICRWWMRSANWSGWSPVTIF